MKSLDQKLANIHADPHGAKDFILADAKDADMAAGLAAPGKDARTGKILWLQEAHGGPPRGGQRIPAPRRPPSRGPAGAGGSGPGGLASDTRAVEPEIGDPICSPG